MTNFEKIKQMNIGELAKVITCPIEFDDEFKKCIVEKCDIRNCNKCCRKYLESEVSE